MKIVYCLTRSDTLGGAQIHVADMAAWLRSNGHDVVVVVGGEGPLTERLSDNGVPCRMSRHLCRAIHPVQDTRAIGELRRIFGELRPDLISLHSAKAGLVGRLAAVGLGVPVLFTAHGWPFTEGVSALQRLVYRTLERITAPLADRIITVSDYDRLLALKARIAAPEKIMTIHNAMPPGEHAGDVGEMSGTVRIIMVARLDVPKDHMTLFDALAKLKDKPWVLDLVGDGPHESQLRVRAEELGLGDRVRFLGLRRDVASLLAESHIFVLTSRWEGFPRSVLEAMRAGLPVIASAVGGMPEAVEEGETGYLVPRDDTHTLRDRLEQMIDWPEERARLGEAGRRRFEERFRFERMADETLAVYEQLVRQRDGRVIEEL